MHAVPLLFFGDDIVHGCCTTCTYSSRNLRFQLSAADVTRCLQIVCMSTLVWDTPWPWESVRGRIVDFGSRGDTHPWTRTPAGASLSPLVAAANPFHLRQQHRPYPLFSISDPAPAASTPLPTPILSSNLRSAHRQGQGVCSCLWRSNEGAACNATAIRGWVGRAFTSLMRGLRSAALARDLN